VASLFRRSRIHRDSARSRARSTRPADQVVRIALGELTPDPRTFLGHAAYVQLAIFETVAHAVATAPHPRAKAALSPVATLSLAKYDGLVNELRRAGHDPVDAMAGFTADTDAFRHDVAGADWYESLVTSYVIAGLLDDFFLRLADGLPDGLAERVRALLEAGSGGDVVVAQLLGGIQSDPRLGSRLALWGRRLVGDTLLVARSALEVPADTRPDEARLEPVFTELIAAHTRRMDAIGLTA